MSQPLNLSTSDKGHLTQKLKQIVLALLIQYLFNVCGIKLALEVQACHVQLECITISYLSQCERMPFKLGNLGTLYKNIL